MSQLERRGGIIGHEGFLDSRFIGLMNADQLADGGKDVIETHCERSGRLRGDNTVRDDHQATSLDGDDAPTHSAQAWVNSENSDHSHDNARL